MDEVQKTEMRNYTMAAGFFVMAVPYLFLMLAHVSGMTPGEFYPLVSGFPLKIAALLLLLPGVILIVLKKRDLTAITFLMMGTWFLFLSSASYETTANILINIFVIILALIILTAKDRKKYLLCILPLLIGLAQILTRALPPVLDDVYFGIIGVIALYFAFACASERISLPLGNLLKADVVTDFKAGGSVLGYLLFGLSTAVWAGVYLFGVPTETAFVLDAVCGMMLIFSGVLLWAVGKMRFTPIMFILMGFLTYIGQFMTGPLFYVAGAMFIVLGLFAVLRTESRILPALMLIIYGVTYFIGVVTIGVAIMPVVSAVLNLLVAAIAVYLAFAVFSQRKLPLF